MNHEEVRALTRDAQAGTPRGTCPICGTPFLATNYAISTNKRGVVDVTELDIVCEQGHAFTMPGTRGEGERVQRIKRTLEELARVL
jgi:5-methylcytosine-specific restriction endonuclease McrA